MHEREARFGEPVEVGDLTLTPLVQVTAWVEAREEGLAGGGSLRPLGVLVDGPDGTQAFGLDGEALPMG